MPDVFDTEVMTRLLYPRWSSREERDKVVRAMGVLGRLAFHMHYHADKIRAMWDDEKCGGTFDNAVKDLSELLDDLATTLLRRDEATPHG